MAHGSEGSTKSISQNRQARHEYFIDETWEAGLSLTGSEVKSLRGGKVNLGEGYVRIEGEEAFLVGVHVPPYFEAGRMNHEPRRPRKLLLHKREIRKLIGAVAREGYTLVPLELYWKAGRAKLEIGLGKGKKLHDKRQDKKAADARREMDRERKGR